MGCRGRDHGAAQQGHSDRWHGRTGGDLACASGLFGIRTTDAFAVRTTGNGNNAGSQPDDQEPDGRYEQDGPRCAYCQAPATVEITIEVTSAVTEEESTGEDGTRTRAPIDLPVLWCDACWKRLFGGVASVQEFVALTLKRRGLAKAEAMIEGECWEADGE